MNNSHGERLKNERLRLGYSQTDFINLINASKTTVFNWERGETYPNSLQLEQMAGMGMDVLYIITGKRTNEDVPIQGALSDEFVYIPVFDTEVCAGNGTDAFDAEPLYHHAFRKSWIKFHNLTSTALAIIKIKGDSMEPKLQDGEYVMLNRESTQPKTGRIFTVRIGNELLAKYVELQLNGNIILKSKNPFYDNITVTPKDAESSGFVVIGEIIQASRDFIV